jgi:hypothetical protein
MPSSAIAIENANSGELTEAVYEHPPYHQALPLG